MLERPHIPLAADASVIVAAILRNQPDMTVTLSMDDFVTAPTEMLVAYMDMEHNQYIIKLERQ